MPVSYSRHMARKDRNPSSPATRALSRKLRGLMDQRGWTIVDVDKRSGVSKSAVANLLNYEQTHTHPSTRHVEMLGAAFGLSAWQMLLPDDAVPSGIAEPEPLDAGLLVRVLTESADLFRKRRELATFEGLAFAAARMYDLVTTGIPIRRASEAVYTELDKIKNGTILASQQESVGAEGGKRGQGKRGAHSGSKTRTR